MKGRKRKVYLFDPREIAQQAIINLSTRDKERSETQRIEESLREISKASRERKEKVYKPLPRIL